MSAPAAAAPSAGDLFAPAPNVPLLSPDIMQGLVDRAATFNIYSRPDSEGTDPAIVSPTDPGKVVGFNVREALHRFGVTTEAPTRSKPLTARNVVGERVGTFNHRWLFTPDDFWAAPNLEPPPTLFDPGRPQRFVMLDSVCRFGDGQDGFRGFGTGRTMPSTSPGGKKQVLITAIGTVLEGFGKFAGHEEGTYVYCGTFSPARGFTGNILLRVADPEGTFDSDTDLPDIEASDRIQPDATYIVLRGQAVPSDPVTPMQTGLIVQQGLRLFEIDFKVRGRGGIKASMRLGRYIGTIAATIAFNPASPGGTSLNPIPFSDTDEFTFTDPKGRPVGSFSADSSEGRVFLTQVGGQDAIRFGGIGRVLSGQGPFAGIGGLMTDNSLVVFTPHVSASVYLLRLEKPNGD